MDMFEEARSLAVMMKMRSLSQSEAARMLGVSQSYVANKLRLLKLDKEIQNTIISYSLTERHARALMRLRDTEKQKEALEKICTRGLTVAQSEALVDLMSLSESPRGFAKGDMLTVIDTFLSSTKQALNTVRATGAAASSKISYENSKIYISIIIDEKG